MPTMTTARRVLPAASLLLVVALASGLIGFVYAHEPARDQVALAVDRERPLDAPILVAGTVSEVGDGRVRVIGDGGTTDVALPARTPVEDLQPTSAASLASGARVNVGVERSDYGFAFSGLVVVTAQ